MKKSLLALLVVIVVAVVAIAVIATDRARINDKQIEAVQTIQSMTQKATDAEMEISDKAAQIEALTADLTVAKVAGEKDLNDQKALLDGANGTIEALNKTAQDVATEFDMAKTELAAAIKTIDELKTENENMLQEAADKSVSAVAKAQTDAEKTLADAKAAAEETFNEAKAVADTELQKVKDALQKAEESAKKALNDNAALEKAKNAAEMALASLNDELLEANVIWDKIEKGNLATIKTDIEAFQKKYPESITRIKFILPKSE